MAKKKNVKNDPYWQVLTDQYYNILLLYKKYSNKNPVMLFDIQEQRGYAYPYQEFKAGLSEKSQDLLGEQYNSAIRDNMMIVFIRDNVEKILRSYSVEIEDIHNSFANQIAKNIKIRSIRDCEE